jgi:hypothetical protein
VEIWGFAFVILCPIGVFLIRLFFNDERAEARVFTIGCAVIVLAFAVVFAIRVL